MRTRPAVAAVILLSVATPALAHRLDEYLQATTVAVDKDHVAVQVRLTPGVEVLCAVLRGIDTDANGTISNDEQRAYADRVLHDLSVTLDGEPLRLRLVSSAFAGIEEMKQGLGEIQLRFDAHVTPGGSSRKLHFENHHQTGISAYMVNCLVPSDPDIGVTGQTRNYDQSFYQLDYAQARVGRGTRPSASWSRLRGWLIADGVVLLASVTSLWHRRRRAR